VAQQQSRLTKAAACPKQRGGQRLPQPAQHEEV
jgi:hypothetical protein